jgi:antitoxin PrlF
MSFAESRDIKEMKRSKITSRGQTTIPKSIREAAGLYAGDVLAFETDGDHLVVRKVTEGRDDHLQGLSEALSEWASPEDEEAWRDL